MRVEVGTVWTFEQVREKFTCITSKEAYFQKRQLITGKGGSGPVYRKSSGKLPERGERER